MTQTSSHGWFLRFFGTYYQKFRGLLFGLHIFLSHHAALGSLLFCILYAKCCASGCILLLFPHLIPCDYGPHYSCSCSYFMNIMIRLGETVNNSLYQAITLAVRKDIGIFVSIGGRSQLLSSLMVEDPNKQLLEFDLPLEVKFMVTRLNGPKIKMDYLEDFRKVFLQFQYPTDEIDQRTREMRQALERQELNQPTLRARQEQERIRNLQYQRNAEIPEPGPGEIRINVSINTTGGWNLGSVPVNIDTDSQLFALELLVRERLVQEFNLPETRYRYVFAGRLYREDDRVSDIVGLSNGMTIYMTD